MLEHDADGRPAAAPPTDDALPTNEELFRQLADSVDVAFLLRSWDPPQFLYVSPGYQKIFGYDPIALQESPEDALRRIHPDDIDRFLTQYWTPCRSGAAAQIEYRIIRTDGEVRWVHAKAAPVSHPDSAFRRSASTVEDITATHMAEAAIRSARVAERANAAKNEFLSRMSHELRTPLNAILGFAQLLQLDTLTAEQENSVDHILRGGRHLLDLIDDVLDISKIESDQLDLSIEAVHVVGLISETVALMKPLAESAGVTLHYRTDPTVDRPVRADHRRLRQVVLNLLSNAIKYNRPGGRVDISCAVIDPGHLQLRVKDTGQGIRAADLSRLFTPFDRLGVQVTGIEGTGIGLALSDRLMKLMGGTLTATSEAGSGSTFIATLPLADEHADFLAGALLDLPNRAEPADGGPSGEPETTRTLLYIEDNRSNIELMEMLLSHRPQWTLVVAGHGALGLELAATNAPDLVLLDLHLPDTDGLKILRRLRSDPATAALTVVVVSADANPHQVDRLLAAGADAYLTKPLNLTEVLGLLSSVDSQA